MSLLETARLLRLKKTWDYARQRSPYYAERLPALPGDSIDADTLRALPILGRAELISHEAQLRCDHGLPAYVLLSGGTSGGQVRLYGSEASLALVQGTHDDEGDGRPRRLTLTTGGGTQGSPPVIASRRGGISVPLRSREGYEWAWRFLTEEHRFDGYAPRVSVLALPLQALKKLVHYILERGHDPRALALESVFSFAAYLSRGWRTLIEDVLGAPITDCYGFTEMPFARAFREPGSDYFFFQDQVLWEVADAWEDAPQTLGVGRLLVSSLLPYACDRVMFRYEMGDLVRPGPYDQARGDRGFEFKGRFRHALVAGEGPDRVFVVLATDVQEALDTNPWVARFGNRRHTGVTRTEDDSFPKWRLQRETVGRRVLGTLEVELTSSPSLFRRQSRELEDRTAAELLRLNPQAQQAVEDGTFELRVRCVPSGTISDEEVCRC